MATTQPEFTQAQTTQPEFTQAQTTQPELTQATNEKDYYYPNFKETHINSNEPKPKTLDTPSGKINYNDVPLQYNYGSPESPIIDSCYFECCEVSSYGGIVCKRETKPGPKEGDPPYVKESYSMMFTFNLQDEECKKCLGKFDEMHRGTAQALAKYKGKVGMYSFNPEHPGEAYKHPIYYKIDPVTCERVPGRNPTIWVKLNNWQNNKTLFTDLEENPIDWSLLSDVEMKLIPLLHVEKIYVGNGKASLQIKLESAIVTDIAPMNTRTRQTKTIDRLKARKGLADTVANQLAQMRMERQDALDHGNVNPTTATLPGSDVGGMHSIPNSGTNSTGSNVQGQENLSAYLGGAPAMNTSPPVQNQGTYNPGMQHQGAQNVPTPQMPQVQLPTATPPGSNPTQFNVQQGSTQPPQQVQLNTQPPQQVQMNTQPQNNQPVLSIQ